MRKVTWSCLLLWIVTLTAMSGCHRQARQPAAPDARRPQIKTEAELAAERQARIERGEIVAAGSPVIPGAERSAGRRRPSPPRPTAGAIQADILLINDAVLTVSEVLYPLRQELESLRRTRTAGGFREEARRLIRRQTQEEMGTLLIYAEAASQLDEQQRKALEAAVDKELENLILREFGGSEARLAAHLKDYGLTKEQLRSALERSMVVSQYSREKFMPQVRIRRDELVGYYRRNISRYQTPEARELLLIELPFEKFLPEGQSWAQASPVERATAKLKAMQRAREAAAALRLDESSPTTTDEKQFRAVAREYSVGLHAQAGGSWGLIGRPLQPPYDTISRLIFQYSPGQTSPPIETETGWYIVRCGRVEPARQQAFAEVQEEIRTELERERLNRLAADYIVRLAANATISPLEPFLTAALERAEQLTASGGQ